MPEQPETGHGADPEEQAETGGTGAPHPGQPDLAADVAADLAERAREYEQRLGWTTRLAGAQLHLLLNPGLVGMVVTNTGVAEEILGVLTRRALDGPVVIVPGTPDRWVFLAGADGDLADTSALVPRGVELVRTRVLLPPSRTAHGRVGWARPPNPHRALPTVLVVLAAARLTIG